MISPGWTQNMDKPWHFASKNGFLNHVSPTSKKASNSQSSNIGFEVSLKRNMSDKMVEKKKRRFWGLSSGDLGERSPKFTPNTGGFYRNYTPPHYNWGWFLGLYWGEISFFLVWLGGFTRGDANSLTVWLGISATKKRPEMSTTGRTPTQSRLARVGKQTKAPGEFRCQLPMLFDFNSSFCANRKYYQHLPFRDGK